MSTFEALSRRVMSEFLQTVVIIDDEAYSSPTKETPPPPPVKGTPPSSSNKQISPPSEISMPGKGNVSKASTAEAPAQRQSHRINTKKIVASFARNGIVCSVIQPESGDNIPELLNPLSERCDIIIFDWQLFDTTGELSLKLMKNLCERDNGDRLRLMCVYTGENDLKKVSDSLQRNIPGLLSDKQDDLTLKKEQITILILAKKETRVAERYINNVVSEEHLHDNLIKCFSQMTSGLLSNAVLAALTGIRQSSYRVISNFKKENDYSYITHRALSNPVNDTSSEIVSLITEEIGTIIDQSDVSNYLDCNTIHTWLDTIDNNKINNVFLNTTCPQEAKRVLKFLVENGISAKSENKAIKETLKHFEKKKFPNTIRESKVSHSLGCSDPKTTDRQFAVLSTLVTRYKGYTPRLTLGTIVHDGTDYLLCLMPPCDSVRIKQHGRAFLFMKLKRSTNQDSVDLIVKVGEDFIELTVSEHPYDSVWYIFKPRPEAATITAKKSLTTGVYYFEAEAPDPQKIYFVADMKRLYAQSFANKFASQVSRVGVSLSAWLHNLKGSG